MPLSRVSSQVSHRYHHTLCRSCTAASTTIHYVATLQVLHASLYHHTLCRNTAGPARQSLTVTIIHYVATLQAYRDSKRMQTPVVKTLSHGIRVGVLSYCALTAWCDRRKAGAGAAMFERDTVRIQVSLHLYATLASRIVPQFIQRRMTESMVGPK
jgi:hypothetical protein